jgi:hypothetical protein
MKYPGWYPKANRLPANHTQKLLRMLKKILRRVYGLYKYRNNWQRLKRFRKMHDVKRIEAFKNLHAGKTIFCLGTGPSLLTENLSLLKDQIVIFTNSSYKAIDQIQPAKKYWFVQDQHRLKEFNEVDRNIFDASFRSFHNIYTTDFNTISPKDVFIMPEIVYRNSAYGKYPEAIEKGDHFSDDLAKMVCMSGHSVIFSAIQLAGYMGAKRIVLLGVDMSFGNTIQQSYFDQTSEQTRFFWPLNYEKHSKGAFISFKKAFDAKGVEFINCTHGTKEDVLDKMPLDQLVKQL